MRDILKGRLERIQAFIKKGFTADIETGIVYSPSRTDPTKLRQRGCYDSTRGYILLTTTDCGKELQLQAHQFVYYIATGKVIPELDHINRNGTDNRIANLREVTHSENMMNTEAKGYTFRKDIRKYRVRIHVGNARIELGSYDTKEEAHRAYLRGKELYHIIGDAEQIKENLRIKEEINPKGFAWNRSPSTKGYSYIKDTNKWRATITLLKKKVHLGLFNTREEAIEAYQEAKRKNNIS